MKTIVTIFYLTICGLVYGQNADSVLNGQINQVDSYGVNQGYWELTKKKISTTIHSCFGGEEGSQYLGPTYTIAKGNYRDGIEVGTWLYYSGDGFNKLISKVTYFDNGIIEVENVAEPYTLEINQDSSVIAGQYYHTLDSIEIQCQNEECLFLFSNGEELLKFPFQDFYRFELELYRLAQNCYDGEIRRHINARK